MIKNKDGVFVELPKDKITFAGDTEEEKKANELIFDLSLENDALGKENERLQKRIDKAIEYINNLWKKKSYYEDIDNCMKYLTLNEFDKADLLNILINGDNNE